MEGHNVPDIILDVDGVDVGTGAYWTPIAYHVGTQQKHAYGWTMSDSDESSEGQREKPVLRIELAGAAEVLRELFNLLEQYAPAWYTEKHHNRAVAALRVLEESRQVGKNEAARSQKAG